jgi:hypothetical protein
MIRNLSPFLGLRMNSLFQLVHPQSASSATPSFHNDREWMSTMIAVFAEFKRVSEQTKKPLAVVFLPEKQDLVGPPLRQAYLTAQFERLGITFLDVSPFFLNVPEEEREKLFIPPDQYGESHYSAEGHTLVGKTTYDFLVAKQLLQIR